MPLSGIETSGSSKIRATDRRIDFTCGSAMRNIVLFSIPLVAGELLQNLYNSVDALIVGNLLNQRALAAVTVSGVISNMVVNFFNGMSVGTNVVISKAFGRKDPQALRDKVSAAFSFAVCLGLVISLLGVLLTPQLLRLAGAKADYYDDALTYLRIYLAGAMFTVIYNNGAGILRATGRADIPLRILLASCLVNVALDVLLVGVIRLGVAGVALATALAQALSVVLVYLAIGRLLEVRCIDFEYMLRRGAETVGAVLRIGLAAGMQSALIGFSNIFVVRYMNRFSTSAVAGIGVAQRLDKFVVLPAKSFGITMTTYVSQNIGAQRFDRVHDGKRQCLLIAVSTTVAISAVVLAFAEQCVLLFNTDPEVVFVGVAMIHVIVPMFWVTAIREVYVGILRGYGKNSAPMLLSLAGMVGFRQLYLAVAMRYFPRIEHIYFCYPMAWVAAAVTLILLYYCKVRKELTGLSNAAGEQRAG